jgi:hypothetical protein
MEDKSTPGAVSFPGIGGILTKILSTPKPRLVKKAPQFESVRVSPLPSLGYVIGISKRVRVSDAPARC